mgnify:FL=1
MSVTITKIEFENVGNTERMTLELSPLTIIRGANGVGKTTLIQAFRRFFRGGYDETVVRKVLDCRGGDPRHTHDPVECYKRAEKGIITATFSDGSYGKRVINTKTRKSTVEMFSVDGEKLGAQGIVDEFAEGYSFDPLALINAPKKDRLKYLEEFLDVRCTQEEIRDACVEPELYRAFEPRDNAFTAIDKLYTAAYEQRTKINTSAEDLRGAVQVVRQGVPTLNEDGKDWAAAEAEAAKAYREATAALQVAEQAVKEQSAAAIHAENQKMKTAAEAAEAAYAAAIAAAKAQREFAIAEANAIGHSNKETIARMESDELQRLQAEQGPIVAEARAAYDQAREQLAAWNKATGARDQIAKMEEQVKVKAGRALFLTNVLKRLKDLRAEKQKSNPIPGLEVRDGEISYEGVEFDAVNTGKRMELCIRMATLRSTKCPILIVDDAINIDDTNWDAFVAAARQSNLQIVAARLDAGDLRIEAYDSLEVAA